MKPALQIGAIAAWCIFTGPVVAKAQDTAQSVLAEMNARAGADVPIIAETDFVCKYRTVTWIIHSRSFSGMRETAGGDPRLMAYGQKSESPEGLDLLFPSGIFRAVASHLDPLTLHWALRDTPIRLLHSANVDGVECKVLALDEAPRSAHLGTDYSIPAIDRASISLFIHAGRIVRMSAQVTRKSLAGRPEAPLILEAIPRYRPPAAGTPRPPSAPPTARFRQEDGNQAVADIAWSPDGKTIACLSYRGGCTMLSVETGKGLGTIPIVRVQNVRFTPDGRYLLLPDPEGSRLRYLDSGTGKESKSVPVGDFNFLVVSPDQSRALAWNRRNSSNVPRVVECFTGRTLYELPQASHGSTMQFSADGTLLAILYADRIEIKDASTGRDVRAFACSYGSGDEFGSPRSTLMALSPDAKLLAIGDSSPSYQEDRLFDEQKPEPSHVYVYQVETGKLIQTLTDTIGSVTALQFSPDGRLLAVGDSDNRGEVAGMNAAVLLWETTAWKPLGAFAVQPQSAIFRLQFSPDSKSFATVAANSGSVEVWATPRQ